MKFLLIEVVLELPDIVVVPTRAEPLYQQTTLVYPTALVRPDNVAFAAA